MNTRTFRAILERIRAAQIADQRTSFFRPIARAAVRGAIFVSNIAPLYLITGALVLPLLLSVPLLHLASWRPHIVSRAFRGSFYGPYPPSQNAKLSADGRFLLGVAPDRMRDNVVVWDVEKSRQRALFPLSARLAVGTTPFALSKDGNDIAFFWSAGAFTSRRASSIGQIYSWKTRKFRFLLALPRTRGEDVPCDVRFSPDQTQIWLASSDSILRFDARSARFLRRDSLWRTGDVNTFSRTVFLSDAPLVARDNWSRLSLWNVTGKPKILGTPTLGSATSLSPDGKRIATFTNTNSSTVNVVDVATGAALWRENGQANALLWSRDGREIFVLRGKTLDVLDSENGQTRRQLILPSLCTRLFPAPSSSNVWALGSGGDLIEQRIR